MTKQRISGSSGSASDAGSYNQDPDTPLPTIERDASRALSETSSSTTTASTTTTTQRLNTPSVSLTPPPSSSASTESVVPTPSSSRRSGSRSIDAALQGLRLSSSEGPVSNLNDIAAATEAVSRGSDNARSASLTPAPTPDLRRRRRSSSAVEQAPHDVRDEEPPEDAFFSSTFQRAITDAKGMMGRLVEVLGSSAIHHEPDSTMRRLHREAGNLAKYLGPQSRTVAFVGDSGVGKSSLLNSLLDFPGLARTSNSGQACTCVVTEYHYHEADTFNVEVEFFTPQEIADQLAEMLQFYRHFHLHGSEINDDSERRDVEERANLARDTFRAMFRGSLRDEAFLTEWPQETVLETLKTWALEARDWAVRAETSGMSLQDCSRHLMQISSELAEPQRPAFWPYIRKVKVFSNAFILSRGLVLVDLPGLRDLNSARRNITERFLLECHEIFVICNIGRAITDEGVASVFDLAERANLSNVGIICTKSDDIKAEEARRDWRGERAQQVRRRLDAVNTAKRECRAIEDELADYASDDDLLEEERDQERDLYRRLRSTERRKHMREFELQEYLINTRNDIVTGSLRNQYANRVPTGEIKVFCVSNTLYWEYRSRPREEGLMGLRLSGILEVRRNCIAIVANSQKRAATRYIRDDIPDLIARLELWVQSGAGTASAERRAAVRGVLEELETAMNRVLSARNSPVRSLGRTARRDFRDNIYERRRIINWSRSAQQAGMDWADWHSASYAAFCRNYGDHYTRTIGSRNWNEEVIEAMTRDLSIPWQTHALRLSEEWNEIHRIVESVTEEAIDLLDRESQDVSVAVRPLSQALTTQQNQLLSILEQSYFIFQTGLNTLRTDALSGIQTSLIGQALNGTYRACNSESGTGSDARRKRIMNRTLSQEMLFETLMNSLKERYQTLADNLQETVNGAVDGYLNVVRGTLDIVRDENVAGESEQDPAFRHRVDGEVTAAQALLAQIQDAIGGI